MTRKKSFGIVLVVENDEIMKTKSYAEFKKKNLVNKIFVAKSGIAPDISLKVKVIAEEDEGYVCILMETASKAWEVGDEIFLERYELLKELGN